MLQCNNDGPVSDQHSMARNGAGNLEQAIGHIDRIFGYDDVRIHPDDGRAAAGCEPGRPAQDWRDCPGGRANFFQRVCELIS